ncbi:TlyA family RNA methyltransferase [Mycoplasma enhydrae]|uniref:TlyA family RNA methyltransferase n=1 Tax=Mycoplasma enhydrae TaxID=2499220 RepID=UPI00197B1525|nr:TlyA family RNA methyltransferase [Mycoplasma enhydrae]MBN4089410.1 TlyA family RNA methyltransferase [Mycoplasma enhydrae]MCV3733466.1 TlyA family RNA methyltransferase [Mycoplasma enhydrae]MCV3753286.1 TlyA family RNA methyltransferase [Mycoplasma enhydrae]
MKKTLKELIKIKHNLDDKTIDSIVMQGKIIVNGEKVFLSSLKFPEDSKIKIINYEKEYVSRGAYKLKEAITKFNIKVDNKVCLDIGSSTGGFVQVLLENNASKVYAVDSGTNQLDYSLRIKDNVFVYEKTNLKNLTENMFDENIDLITCDVSFISLKHVFEICNKIFNNNCQLVALIKPQFEASSKYVQPGGFVDKQHHKFIIDRVIEHAKKNDFVLVNEIVESPILGEKSKNIEYLSHFEKRS